MSELVPHDQLRREIEEERARLAQLDGERAARAARLAVLETRFQTESAAGQARAAHAGQPDVPGAPAAKVRLFRSLFRGRPDVYPTRFVSKRTGTPGYAPASGRLHRLHPRKTEVRIFDYVDREVPLLLRMFEKRLRTYRAIGYARGATPLGFGEPVDSAKSPEAQASLLDLQEEA